MHAFWEVVLSNALIATIMAFATMLLSRVWKNPAAIHLLWVAVLLKLFTPPVFTTAVPFSSQRLTTSDASFPIAQPTTSAQNNLRKIAHPAVTKDSASTPLLDDADAKLRSGLPATPWTALAPRTWHFSNILLGIWLAGSFGIALRQALSIRRFALLLRGTRPPEEVITTKARQLGRDLGLSRIPPIAMSPAALPPLVWSVGGPPRVILPIGLFSRIDGEAQSAILAHELAHIRRRDYLVRLLELAATTLFWWHPIVWWACLRLRDLEEQCCDGRVLELAPHQARTYATALIETLEFLAAHPRVAVPLPTAVNSSGSLARRIRMLTEPQTIHLSAYSSLIVATLVALPLAMVFAESPPKANEKPADEKPANERAAQRAPVIHGRVTDETGAPLAGALVRVAIPATDMRFVDSSSSHKLLETRTDLGGGYRLELPDVKQPTPVSIDAMIPGHRRLVGTLYSGGDPRRVEAKPSEVSEASMTLIPALYFKGVVVDEQGQPIPAVEISANANSDHWSAGVERTVSKPDGNFEIFSYPLQPLAEEGDVSKGVVFFFHPDYVNNRIDDVYSLTKDQREILRIVMPTGHQIAGTILDDAGKPVADAMVKATSDQGGHRKATMTDADGKFVLRGLLAGPTTLKVRALDLKQKVKLPIAVDRDQLDLKVRLQPIALPEKLPTVTVLGMQLTDITPQLKSAYDLYNDRGTLILDPGKDSARLGIGQLAEGYNFWMVGEKRIGSVREFIERILAEAATQTEGDYSIRVVYNFSSLEMDGSNTQYLKLTKQDLDELRTALASLAPQ